MISRKYEHQSCKASDNALDRYNQLIFEADKLDDLAYRTLASDTATGDWERFSAIKKAALNKRAQAKRERAPADRTIRLSTFKAGCPADMDVS